MFKFWKVSHRLPFWLIDSAPLSSLHLITLIVLGESTNYEASHSVSVSIPNNYPFYAEIFASGSWYSNDLNLSFSLNVRDDFTGIYNLQYYCFKYFNFQILREKPIRQKCLDWIITRWFTIINPCLIFSSIEFWFANKECKYLKVFTTKEYQFFKF